MDARERAYRRMVRLNYLMALAVVVEFVAFAVAEWK